MTPSKLIQCLLNVHHTITLAGNIRSVWALDWIVDGHYFHGHGIVPVLLLLISHVLSVVETRACTSIRVFVLGRLERDAGPEGGRWAVGGASEMVQDVSVLYQSSQLRSLEYNRDVTAVANIVHINTVARI